MILISAGLGLGATNTSILLNPPPDRPIGVEVEMQLRRVQVMAHDPKKSESIFGKDHAQNQSATASFCASKNAQERAAL
ncbi:MULTISPECIES: hypothetical protein [unclassified Mesorhizobium]|uniref:hypothetical protein n=1 Tax=unclassified Mesorhizobium TaxID=325217 RepID=UPI0013E3F1B8|nr:MULTISPECIES: hypothetical protein [unclassified Mesorhizobium]